LVAIALAAGIQMTGIKVVGTDLELSRAFDPDMLGVQNLAATSLSRCRRQRAKPAGDPQWERNLDIWTGSKATIRTFSIEMQSTILRTPLDKLVEGKDEETNCASHRTARPAVDSLQILLFLR
jgi:hypothetical protein